VRAGVGVEGRGEGGREEEGRKAGISHQRQNPLVDKHALYGVAGAVVPDKRLLGAIKRQRVTLEAGLGQCLGSGAQSVLVPAAMIVANAPGDLGGIGVSPRGCRVRRVSGCRQQVHEQGVQGAVAQTT